jgi:hypothetical protein
MEIQEEKIDQFLKVTFSGEEKVEMGSELARLIREKAEIEEQLKSVSADLKSQSVALGGKINSFAEKIRSGYEMANVSCTVKKDYKKGIVKTFRNDTGELVKERPMTDEEKQIKMELKEKEEEKK